MKAYSPARRSQKHRLFWLLVLGLTLLWPLLGSSPAAASDHIIFVKSVAVGSGSGADWTNAAGLQDALGVAADGDEIWVAVGVYTPGTSVDSTFVLTDGVAIYGGFAATETQRSQRNWSANPTVLSGDIDNNDTFKDADGVVSDTAGIQGTNASHVVTDSGVTNSAVLDGFFITAGSAGGTAGGGMHNNSGSPTLANLSFSGNFALSGGGMYNDSSSSPTLANVTFFGNTALSSGGGMNNFSSSSPILTNVTFSGNAAGTGGGMNNSSSSSTLTNVTFSGNSADDGGSSPTIRFSLVQSVTTAVNGNLDGFDLANAPQFVRNPDPGDGDWTTLGDNDYGDLRLLPVSPAIDKGDNAADLDGGGALTRTISSVISDLGGNPRRVAVTRITSTVDLGAYETPNSLPAFDSSPPLTATEGHAYTYVISSRDPNQPTGSGLSLSLLTGPGWLTLNDSGDGTGTLSGTPNNADMGDHAVTLQVQDAGGLFAQQSFTVTVNAVSAAAVVAQDVSDSQGNYGFDTLAPGAYTLTFAPPAGFERPEPVTVAVEAGETTSVPDVSLSPIIDKAQNQIFLPNLSQ